MKLNIASLIILILIFSSCTQEDTCRESKDVLLRAGFFTSTTSNSLTIDSITAMGLNKDSLYKNTKKINKIALPLNNSVEESIFILNINGVHDTINIRYTNDEYFISYACGIIITHAIDTVSSTNHLIKSLKIVNRDINTADVQHLQILL